MSPTHRFSPTRARLASLFAAVALVAIAALGACSERAGDLGPFEPQFAPGGGGPPIKVTGTDPTGAEQEQIVDVRVFGSNFEPGSSVEYKLNGVATGKVRTNSVTFVSGSELITNVTIDADADLGLYDVEVVTPPGKKGVGTELFEVRVKGGGIPSADLTMSGALTAGPSVQTVSQDNPQMVEISMTDYVVAANLANTHANAVAEWADSTAADLCRFNMPPGKYDQDSMAVVLRTRLLNPDWTPHLVHFYKPAITAGEEGQDSRISDGGGLGIGRSNGNDYYGFLLVTSADDLNDATLPRVFRIEAGHGTVRSLARAGNRPRDPIVDLRCRLMDEITVTVGPSF